MTKKKYILKVLELLNNDWEPARGLGIVIWELNDEKLLNSMYNIFKGGIKNLHDEKLKVKVRNSFNQVKKIRNKEKIEWLENERELDILESELEKLI